MRSIRSTTRTKTIIKSLVGLSALYLAVVSLGAGAEVPRVRKIELQRPKTSNERAAHAVRPFPTVIERTADGGSPNANMAAGTGLNYGSGFEPGEGFVPGFIGQGTQPTGCGGVNNPCWATP